MGDYRDDLGRKCYTPDNDESILYIPQPKYGSIPFGDMMEAIRGHFGEDVDLDSLEIGGEEIHTRCLGYDLYDSGDWDQYLIITKR